MNVVAAETLGAAGKDGKRFCLTELCCERYQSQTGAEKLEHEIKS